MADDICVEQDCVVGASVLWVTDVTIDWEKPQAKLAFEEIGVTATTYPIQPLHLHPAARLRRERLVCNRLMEVGKSFCSSDTLFKMLQIDEDLYDGLPH